MYFYNKTLNKDFPLFQGFLFKTLIFLGIASILFGVWKESSIQQIFRRQIKAKNQEPGQVDEVTGLQFVKLEDEEGEG